MNIRVTPRYTLVWGACYTLGARFLSKNTVGVFMKTEDCEEGSFYMQGQLMFG